ncbi:YihY/virulence factor BrkB family protein [Corynebacterium minutissimum]|uniref:YihY family protein n=1 Tax=Corynebacterium minutissimum TaxID=38301 RepID=A0A2X4RX79_9CORY|nr:YihY/virulence factor BrkB family protein [Corynebacterium minutissimum]KHO30256.1 trehalose-binding protein [Corynebacterium minutissimum]QPS60232.1 YihY/virulence factor BrkB family protein [Corynebacterium minutissimum]QQA78978.1 YihY/virulence factor BrkB family protein [Corynebacterium minutissimum]SQI00930.1 YihY family protein [Corynebacterium minutissimum]VEG05002.1 YihY family protein [Corynebacterium minutissimum]
MSDEEIGSNAIPVERPETIVPWKSSSILEVEGHDDARDPFAKGNRLRRESWGLVVRRTWNDFFHDAFMDRAAGMTYFTLMAFAPTVLAAYSIATLIFSSRREEVEQLTSQFIEQYIPSSFSEEANVVVSAIIGSSAQGTFALIVSLAISLFSASAYVRAFARTANTVYGRVEGRGIIRTWSLMWGLTAIIVIGAVIVLFANLLRDTVISEAIYPLARQVGLEDAATYLVQAFLPVWNWLRFPVTVVVVLTLIAVLYHFSPNVRPSRFRWITYGSVVALVGTVGVWGLFGLYITYLAAASAYGALSTILALFMAIWLMNTALIVGIKIDAEVLRAKELQLGMHSERFIQAPPRSDASSRAQARAQKRLEYKAREISDSARQEQPE